MADDEHTASEASSELANQSMSVTARVVGTQAALVPWAISRAEKFFFLFFLLSLPLVNPWVRGDGIGYYAYVRAMLIEHGLRFENDWRAGNSTFVVSRVDDSGRLKPDQFTSTGRVDNHFAVGAAMLWAPWLFLVHAVVLGLNGLGAHLPADGFFFPYRLAMALSTALYGFLGLFFSFRLAREYFDERWAFLATLGIWLGSSLPVYMYFNPSWSHAHSAFAVGLFIWYWHRTRDERTWLQWSILGLLSGLMLDVYYPNFVFLLLPLQESLRSYWKAAFGTRQNASFGRLFAANMLYAATAVVAFSPTLITRWIIYGSPSHFGYGESWFWTSPALKSVLFSSNHGLFSWTPVLLLAVLGLLLSAERNVKVAGSLLLSFLAFYYFIASYSNWAGLSSFGNRFFISMTPAFVLGLAATLERFGRLFESGRRGFAAASLLVALFVLWNAGFIFQWGTHLVPARGPISWRNMAYNQVTVVPERLRRNLMTYLVRRKAMMERIEQEDLKQIESRSSANE